jgi:hypothetical protein
LTSVDFNAIDCDTYDHPFINCNALTTVNIGSEVKTIPYGIFYGCTGLTSVTIPNSVTAIGYEAFRGCTGLTSVTIPNSVTSIGFNAFAYCTGLISVDFNAINCAEAGYPFSYCSALTIVNIGSEVEIIPWYAFGKCSNLTSVTIPNSVTTIGPYAFEYCSNLTFLTIGNSVTAIGDRAFSNCRNLTSVTNLNPKPQPMIPSIFENVTIGNVALYVPSGSVAAYKAAYTWRDFNIMGLSDCPSGTFGAGDALTWEVCEGRLTIGGVGVMPDYGAPGHTAPWYAYRADVEAVVVESGVRSIGAWAFADCSRVVSVALPGSVTSIGQGAFIDCPRLTTIEVAADNPSYSSEAGVLFTKSKATIIQYPAAKMGDTYALSESVTTIGDRAFYKCGALKSITLPASLTSIGEWAFGECRPLTDVAVNWIATPPAISRNVFADLTLHSITLHVPSGTGIIYVSADIWQEFNIVEASHPGCPSGVFGEGNALTWEFCEGTLTIGGTGAMPSFGYPNYAPWNMYDEDITTIFIGEGIENIGAWAFARCINLESITIPEKVTSIGSGAFEDCRKLAFVLFSPSSLLTSIGYDAFFGCESLKSIIIPEKVTSIETRTFGYCSNLASVTLPEGILSIGIGAFEACTSLESITIPTSVTSIDKWAFGFCRGLTSLVIPEKVTSIGDMAFYGCQSLKTISLPASLRSIGEEAFADCSKVVEITVNWTTTPPAITEAVFAYVTLSNITLHIPHGTKAMYEAAEVWKEFNIVEQSVGIQVVSRGLTTYVQDGVLHVGGLAAGEAWGVYDVSGRRMRVANGGEATVYLTGRGVYIVRAGNRSVKVVY